VDFPDRLAENPTVSYGGQIVQYNADSPGVVPVRAEFQSRAVVAVARVFHAERSISAVSSKLMQPSVMLTPYFSE
jgi:hypothetical protein